MSIYTYQQIKTCLDNDGVICYPTEGVWGLGCDPKSKKAFDKLLAIKQRPQEKGVILLASQYQQITSYVDISGDFQQQLEPYWPGFTTCLLPKSKGCPDYLSGKNKNEVAVRITNYKLLSTLCDYLSAAIVSTSANLSGQPPVKTVDEAKSLFGHQVDYYWDTALGGQNKPSQIIRLDDNQVTIIRA